MMGSLMTNKSRILGPHHSPLCTRAHQIGALALVAATFFLTRLFDESSLTSCNYSSAAAVDQVRGSQGLLRFPSAGGVSWPQRGYGSQLSLRIYVYDEVEIDGLRLLLYGRDGKISPDACIKGQWGTQVKIHTMLLQSRFRTRKKEEADLFFVPSYVKCVRMMGGLNDKEINQTYVKGDRTDKRDTSAFNAWKDIIIPGNVDDGMTNRGAKLVQPLPLSKRKYLANFLGRAQGKIGRLQLVELAKQYADKLESPELKFSGPDKLGRREYFEHLRNAKFCLAPRGESSWTLRFYESFFVECVPVIISDYAELPFQNVIDYTEISIKWPWNRIGPELLEYLESIPGQIPALISIVLALFSFHPSWLNRPFLPVGDIERMIAHGRQVRCLWVYAPESEPCSAFNGILWELQRKVRQFHQSPETFWLHNGSVVNRNLVEFSHWKPPMPLP